MSAFLEDDGDRATLDAEDVFDLVGGSLGHLRMKRSLERITARGNIHHRRRAAVSAMAGVVAITALGAAAVTFAQSGDPMHAVSTAGGATGVASATRMADPDWTVTASAGGGYLVEISALGDVARLNATLKSLGIELKVTEKPPTGADTACPATGGTGPTVTSSATGTATATATTSTTADTSPAHSGTATDPTSTPSTASSTATSPSAPSPSPTPTPMSFPVSGTFAEFTFTGLPKESTVSFTATDRGSRAGLGTMRISDECLPVFGTGS